MILLVNNKTITLHINMNKLLLKTIFKTSSNKYRYLYSVYYNNRIHYKN